MFESVPQLRRQLLCALTWALAVTGLLTVRARPATSKLDEDEIYWVGSVYYYHLAFQRGDWRNPDWQLLPARENPPLAKYILGLGLATSGRAVSSIDLLGTFYLAFEHVPGAWGSGEDSAKRSAVVQRMNPEFRDSIRRGAEPQLDGTIFFAGRWTMLVCAIATSFIVFATAAQAVGPLGGLLAGTLLLVHPAVAYAYNHALSDAVALLFSSIAATGVFLLGRHLLARPAGSTGRGFIGPAAIAGGMLGLACAAKMNSLLLVLLAGVVIAFAIARAGWRDRSQIDRGVISGIVVLVAAFVVFIAINPTLIGAPVDGLIAAVREHHLTENVQRTFRRDHLDSVAQQFSAVARLSSFSTPALVALCLAAGWSLRSERLALRFVAAWFLIAVVCVTLWIPLPRSRNVLPVVLPGCILLAFLAAQALEAGARRLSSRVG